MNAKGMFLTHWGPGEEKVDTTQGLVLVTKDQRRLLHQNIPF